jgi:predicted secreted Zn-dependent protease
MRRADARALFAPPGWLLAACLITFVAPGQALAFSTTSRTHLYDISGSTANELTDAMAEKGPHGYWAYTTWYVHWSASCEVSVTLDHTMPRWTDHDTGPAALRADWDRMMKSLWRHEKGHAEHGLEAAREIEASHCAGDPHKITDKWAEADKVYDEETDHGARQGVHLPYTFKGTTGPAAGQASARGAQP